MRSFRQIYSPFSTSVPPLSTEPKLFNTISTQFLLTLTHANIKTSKWVSRFLEGQKVIGRFMRYCFFLAGCQSRKRLRLVDAVIQQHKPIFWHGPTKHPSSECPIWPFCQTKIRRVLWQVSVDSSMTSVKLSADSVDEEKKSPVKAGNDSFWKWCWLTGPSIHGDLKKSRRF